MTERIPLYLDSGGIASEIPVGDTVAASRLDLTDYLKLSGRAGGQNIYGGTASGNNLTLQSTSHATKGKISLGIFSAYSQVDDRLGLGTVSPIKQLELTKSIELVDTIDNDTGVLFKNGNRFLHNFQLSGTFGENTFCGVDSGNFAMTGSAGQQGCELSGFGRRTLKDNTTGNGNSAFGVSCLEHNTTGSYITAVGYYSAFSNISGTNNVSVGRESLFTNVAGSYHTAIGAFSLKDCDTATTTGANTAIGYNTGLGIITGVNNTIIGANVTGLTSTLSGNVILSDGTGSIKYRYDGTNTTIAGNIVTASDGRIDGKLSVGTGALPVSRLDVTDTLTPTSGTSRSFFLQTTINPVSNSSANLYAQQISLSVLGTVDKTGVLRAANFTGSIDAACSVGTLQGFNAIVQVSGIAGNSKTATNLIGANFGIANLASAYTVTNGYGWKIQAPINSGGGTLSNVCGGAIENHTAAGKNTNLLIGTSTIPTDQNWSIYNSSTYSNYFAGNIGIGGTTFGTDATNTLLLKNGTVPGSSPVDAVQLFSVDISAGNASLGIRTETALVTESVVSDRTLSIKHNGTTVKICIKS